MTNDDAIEYGDDEFLVVFPLYFVVDERATETVAPGIRDVVNPDPRAFCGGNVGPKRCVAIFTDHDLARRHIEGNDYDGCVAISMSSPDRVAMLLNNLYPDHFHAVLVDVGRDGSISGRWQTIPRFVAQLRNPRS